MRRVVVAAGITLLTLGIAAGVWAARDDPKRTTCPTTTYLAEDPGNAKVMTYHRRADCD